jgi:hypothetical protein
MEPIWNYSRFGFSRMRRASAKAKAIMARDPKGNRRRRRGALHTGIGKPARAGRTRSPDFALRVTVNREELAGDGGFHLLRMITAWRRLACRT